MNAEILPRHRQRLAELNYLVKLADWCAGQGVCPIEPDMEEPEEWCFRMWSELGPENGDGYSADALAEKVAALICPDEPKEPPVPDIPTYSDDEFVSKVEAALSADKPPVPASDDE